MNITQSTFILFILLFFAGFANPANAQLITEISGEPEAVKLDPDIRLPGTGFVWEKDKLPETGKVISADEEMIYIFPGKAPVPFTGLAVGWDIEGVRPHAGRFKVNIRSRQTGDSWPEWVNTTGYLEPVDSPSGLYWAMLYVTPDGKAHDEFEVEIAVPVNSALAYVTITAADARSDKDHKTRDKNLYQFRSDMPEIISRAGWWGDLPPGELNPDYSPQQINITHAAVHHTVTANEPPDPPRVVRQIWDWHVNDNGWLDIGYNFMIDHNGSIYQGRYNPWLADTDVRGAHAGNANSQSVGIALLGQFHPGANPAPGDPASLALDALIKLISWRFDQQDIDPLGSAAIPVNPSGAEFLSTIFGHRDVSATACPGDNLYVLLPQIRESAGEPVVEEFTVLLGQNYPNPFRTSSTIPVITDMEMEAELILYTVRGEQVRNLFTGVLNEGENNITVDLNGLASGVYFYELVAGNFRQARQMVYIR